MTSRKCASVNSLGQRIKELRTIKGILLRQLAAVLEVDTALVSKLENGERRAQRQQISVIANFLEIDESELIVLWLSDKIREILENEPLAQEVITLITKERNKEDAA